MDQLQATTAPEKKQETRKSHRMRKTLIILGSIVVLLLVATAYTGLYQVPVLSAAFGTNEPVDLGVRMSAEALASIKTKFPMKLSDTYVDYGEARASAFSGSVPVDSRTTDEEITSWLQQFEGADPLITGVQVKRYEGGMEISGMLRKYVSAPVYVKVDVAHAGGNAVTLRIRNAKLGRITLPEKYRAQAEEFFQDRVNHLLTSIPGLTIDTYELHDGLSVFKGTFPATAAKSQRGWSDLFDL